ncbi:MAG: hypothetical protein ACLTCB_09295 [Merdibacter sp.]
MKMLLVDAGSYDDLAINEQDHAQFQKFEHMLNEQGDISTSVAQS